MGIIRRVVQGKSLEVMKKEERPAFKPAAVPKDAAYVCTRRTRRSFRWAGILTREGFRWSRGRCVWVYDQHDDGALVTLEEADWIANRLRDVIAGDIGLLVGTGLFVEPIPDDPPALRPYLRTLRGYLPRHRSARNSPRPQ